MNRITVQGEPNNSLKFGKKFFFYCDAPLSVGDEVILTNHSRTVKIDTEIVDNTRSFYEGVMKTNGHIDDATILTELM